MKNRHGVKNKYGMWIIWCCVAFASTSCATVTLPVIPPVTPSPATVEATAEATAIATETPITTPGFSVDTSHPITQEVILTSDVNASNPQLLAAMQDLAARVAVGMDEIEVIGFDYVVWPDKGLGCPHPEMVYQQVEVDGLLIHLRVGDVVYEYHSGEGLPPVLCENSMPAQPTIKDRTPKSPDINQ